VREQEVYSESFQKDSKVEVPNRMRMPPREEYHSKVLTELHLNDFGLSRFGRQILEFRTSSREP